MREDLRPWYWPSDEVSRGLFEWSLFFFGVAYTKAWPHWPSWLILITASLIIGRNLK